MGGGNEQAIHMAFAQGLKMLLSRTPLSPVLHRMT